MRDVVLKAGMDGNFGNEVSVLLGCAGESAVTRLVFSLPLFDGNYYIDIELPNGAKSKDNLVQSGEFWEYIVPYPVTEYVGIGSLQVVVCSNNENFDVIWKTVMLATKVQASVNATDYIANEHKDIIEQINDKILGIEYEVGNKVDVQLGKVLSSNDYTDDDKNMLTNLGETNAENLSLLIPLSQKGAANGVPSLNANCKTVQMPEVQKISTIVSNPDFTNQPTISGSLNASFEKWETNFYYVTLKDVSGVALPSGQFKLTLTKDGYGTAVNQIFSLTSLATGNSGTLVENTAVDFSAIGASWKMRLRYVSSVSINLTGNLQLNDMQIDITGMINTTYYLTVKLTPFANSSYFCVTGVSIGSDGSNGMIFQPGGGQNKKFIFNTTTLKIFRRKKEITSEFKVTHMGSDTLAGATSYTQSYTNGVLYAVNHSDINTTPITNIAISSSTMQFANGTEITIKDSI